MITAINSLRGLRPFFEQFPEEQWLVEQLNSSDERYCVMGFVALLSDLKTIGTPLAWSFVEVEKKFEQLLKDAKQLTLTHKKECVKAYHYPLTTYWNKFVSVNNGWVEEYTQLTPKQRVLAYLNDLEGTATRGVGEILLDIFKILIGVDK